MRMFAGSLLLATFPLVSQIAGQEIVLVVAMQRGGAVSDNDADVVGAAGEV